MLTLIPAYGRDYKNKKSVLEDWNNNKDFKICDMFNPYDGSFCNKQDVKGERVKIRYNKLRNLVII